ncbi:MAG: hypothetical protein JNN06_07295 [Gemmobacter sp.]|uniref:hypothetical protein n=1 Tax=Gemmobacter sp. TaxID=1898957 RepID=UPI001A3A90E3|nr:hypothetical protein [Gemmobacter sp.]MBL8562071.1 hypothetical protein [Gemmobacter sp.]
MPDQPPDHSPDEAPALPAALTSDLALESRLLAHRAFLAFLVSRLPPPDQAAIRDWLQDRQILRDGQEDPGAVEADRSPEDPARGALAMADEYQRLLQRLPDAPFPDPQMPGQNGA